MKSSNNYFPLLLPVFCLLLLSACEQAEQVAQAPLRPVKSITVSKASAERERDFSGTSKSSEEARLSFKVAGSIESRNVNVGDMIKPGDLIAELDATPYELQSQQASANLASAQASGRNADANYQRLRTLYENNNASRNELDSARANAESSQAQVKVNQKELEIAELNIKYTRLIANNDCSIASVSVEANENVSAGQEVVRADCGNTLEVEIAVPESLIQGIVQDSPALITFSSIPGRIFSGKVTEIAIAATGGGNTFPVIIKIDDEHPELRSGLAANIKISTQASSTADEDVILVPAHTVVEDSEGRHVFLLDSSDEDGVGIVRRTAVVIGELTSAGLEITSGLNEGDLLITAGITVVIDGMKVKI